MAISKQTAVLIVGGGPVGLALAADLGWRGVPCILVERRDGSISLPKMNMVSARTMEFCRRWGIAREVRRLSIPEDFPRNILFVTNANGYELARYEYPGRADAVLVHSPEYLQRCSQILFDPLMRRQAAGFGCVEMLYQTELRDFAQDGEQVTAHLVDVQSNQPITVMAKYLVGCDGAESLVREKTNIAMLGNMALSNSANIFYESEDLAAIMPHGKAIMQWIVGATGYWAGIVSVDGIRQWRLGVRERVGSRPPSEQEAAALIRKAVGRDFNFRVVSSLNWTRKSVVADRYHDRRVFLAGDSAHQLSPTGGFGMNTGIADAIDLSWKLAATLDGWGGPKLLESYDAERRRIGEMAVREGEHNFKTLASIPSGPEIDEDTGAGRALRHRISEYIHANGFEQEYESDGVIFGYHYEGSPIVCSEAGAPPPTTVKNYIPSARPGHRAPHAWIGDGRSTLDLYGRNFTLLCGPGSAPGPLIEAAKGRGMPIDVAQHQSDGVAALYEGRMVLVRPDGHVAWRGDQLPADAGSILDRVTGAAR